jgi:hypothetical protein
MSNVSFIIYLIISILSCPSLAVRQYLTPLFMDLIQYQLVQGGCPQGP